MERLPSKSGVSEQPAFLKWVEGFVNDCIDKVYAGIVLLIRDFHSQVRLDPVVVEKFEAEYHETLESFRSDSQEIDYYKLKMLPRVAYKVAIVHYPHLSTARTAKERTIIDSYLMNRLGIGGSDED